MDAQKTVQGPGRNDTAPGFRWAVPSWVVPGSVAENCRHLATRPMETRPDEVALCLFETASCLSYGKDDLPKEPMGLSFHAHLPLDLPWEDAANIPKEKQALARMGQDVARVCQKLLAKIAHLSPWAVVLHPPACGPERVALLLEAFLAQWGEGPRVLLENTKRADVLSLLAFSPELFAGERLALCLDLGHLVRYKHEPLLGSPLVTSAPMAHWNLAGPDGHRGLEVLSPGEEELARAVMARLPKTCLHVIELFSWADALRSLPIVRGLWQEVHAHGRAKA